MAKLNRLRWYQSLGFKTQLAIGLLAAWLLGGIILVMKSKGTGLVLEESRRLIEQTGNNAVAELQLRLTEIASLARTLAEASKVLPKNSEVLHKSLPPLINFQGDMSVAGGGFWPEPFAFDQKKERSSFFWGRNKDGALEYYDDYNKPGAGYHNEEWYVVVRYAKPGRCFWSRSYMDPYSYQPMTTCTVGIFEQDRFVGEVTIDVKLEGLGSLVESWQKKTGGYVFILDRNNKFLTFPKLDLVKKVNKDDKGNRTEEFILASQLAEKEKGFAPLAKALQDMNDEILSSARTQTNYNPDLAKKVDDDSYQIDAAEAQFINAVIADPLDERTNHSKLYKDLVLENDFMTGQKSLAYIFHVPSSYWKVVVVKPFSEASAVADSITRLLITYLTVTVLIAAILAFWLLRRLILKPLAQTTASIQFTGELIQKNELAKIPRSDTAALPNNEIGLLKGVFAGLTSRVIEANQSLQEYSKKLEELNIGLEGLVKERTRALQTILSNVQSGFLLVDREGKVQDGFTRSCLSLFGNRIKPGIKLVDLLEMGRKEAGYYQLAVLEIFEDLMPENVTTAQLPTRFVCGNRTLNLAASAVRDDAGRVNHVLFTITDVTALELAEQENLKIKALVSILRQREAFNLFLADARRSLTDLREVLTKGEQGRARFLLHTLKGNCGAFGLFSVSQIIHQAENEETITIKHVETVEESIRVFLKDNSEILGINYEEGQHSLFHIEQGQLAALEGRIGNVATLDEAKREVSRWAHGVMQKSARELLGPLPDFVRSLAQRLGKEARLEIEGGDMRLEPEIFVPILQNLTHLVRNAIDHGLEEPSERGEKPVTGTLKLSFQEDAETWMLKVLDDGRGIATDALVEKAIEAGLLNAEQAAQLSEKDKLELIFRDGLSTANTISDISGRGVGMSAMRYSVQAVGGSIDVASEAGRGTSFAIRIPKPTLFRRIIAA